MTNTQTIEFDSIILDLKANSFKQAFQLLATHIHKLIGISKDEIFDQLMADQKEESCAIGNGVAIPHMRLPRLTRPMTIFAKIPTAIEFDSTDGAPVDMVCLILSPEHEGAAHLQRLAKITRFFNNKNILNELERAEDKDDIRLILRNANHQRIAA